MALFKEIKLGRQAAWRLGCIRVGVVTLVGGTVQEIKLGRQAAWRPVGGWNSDRVSVSIQTPWDNEIWRSSRTARGSTSSASSSVQLPQHAVFCGALNYFFALVKLGFVPTAKVFVIGNGFVGADRSVWEVLAVQHTFNSFTS